MIEIELNHQVISCIPNVHAPAYLGTALQGHFQPSHMLVAEKYLLYIRSLLDQPTTFDFVQTKTYLKSLNLAIALVINFSRNELQIYGVTTT